MSTTNDNKQWLIKQLADLVELPIYAIGNFTIKVDIENRRVEVDCTYLPKILLRKGDQDVS